MIGGKQFGLMPVGDWRVYELTGKQGMTIVCHELL
jgi:hypothetical protein